MRFIVYIFALLIICLLSLPHFVSAQEIKEEYLKARVVKVLDEGQMEIEGNKNPFQKIQVQVLDEGDKELILDYGGGFRLTEDQKVSEGEVVVLIKFTLPDGQEKYNITDKYRLDNLWVMGVGFFLLVLAIAGKKGIGAILGLVVSFIVIIKFIVPQILGGTDPLFISIAGSFFILIVTIYLAHGFSKQTTIAVIATFLTLVLTGIMAVLAVKLTSLTGLGSEDAYNLQLGSNNSINLRGLLLGGIIIGALGVLDDITTTQTATVFELFKTDPRQKFETLFKKGLLIGKEHVSSLVNTLVLAYAGASLPLFIIFVFNPKSTPLWFILNSEIVFEEIVRTLIGSTGLIIAVPLVTLLSAWFITKNRR